MGAIICGTTAISAQISNWEIERRKNGKSPAAAPGICQIQEQDRRGSQQYSSHDPGERERQRQQRGEALVF